MKRNQKNTWEAIRLGDHVNFQTGKLNSNAAKADGAFPFFTCSQETYRTDTYAFDGEYVLLAGNNANGIYPLKYFNGKFDAYQRTYAISSTDEQILDNRFLYYSLRPQLELMRSVSTGAATKFLTLTILKDLRIQKPTIDCQIRIASILSAYDDLIENNTRRLKLLEEMTQRIYREWFVNFHFPGHERVEIVESKTGNVPHSWTSVPFRIAADFINGFAFGLSIGDVLVSQLLRFVS
jgi:type I restriction enzyme S subunit